MDFKLNRRSALKAGAALAAAAALPVTLETAAQAKPTLRFAAVFSDKDIRAEMIRMLAKDIEGDFRLEPFYGGTLFKQGTELVALQRDNLEMGNIAPQDISKQLAAWSILTCAYLFRDANHLNAFFAGELGAQMKKMVEDKLKVRILGPTFFGTRQVGLKPKKKIATPADMTGIKLRMPPGDAWQLLGRSLGANPTPMAYAEVYTGLQTGAIDGQDNPLPTNRDSKFFEVTKQIVLTSHLVDQNYVAFSKKVWDGLKPDQQKIVQKAADDAAELGRQRQLKLEGELEAFFKEKGLKVYAPDVAAFRAKVQKDYLESKFAKDWPAGLVDKINAVK